MSAIPQVITPNPHTNLLNVYIQIANKMGFKKNQQLKFRPETKTSRPWLPALVLLNKTELN
jgi:hypothetical protein